MKIRIEESCAGIGFAYTMGAVLEVGVDIPNRIAMDLLNGGLASPIRTEPIETADKPVHIGGGTFRLPDCRKVKGKAAALAAMEDGSAFSDTELEGKKQWR